MSQLLSGTETLSRIIQVRLVPTCLNRNARLILSRAICHLALGLGMICAAAAATSAQQAQVVKLSEPITCNSKKYQLRLVMAEGPIKSVNARAFGIVLTPEDPSESKVFCLYWMNPESLLATHRDDTSGKLNNSLIEYANGQTGKGIPVVNSFFAEAKCSAEDPQLRGIQGLLASGISAKSFRDATTDLGNRNVNVDADHIENAAPGALEQFKRFESEIGFARAIRSYVSSVLAADGRLTDPAGSKPSVENEKQGHLARIQTLESEVQQLNKEKEGVLGGTPFWVRILFLTTLVLLLLALGIISLAFYDRKNRSQRTPQTKGTKGSNEDLTQQSGKSEVIAAQISGQLGPIIDVARNLRREIEVAPKTGQSGTGQNQRAKTTDELVDAFMHDIDRYLSNKNYKQNYQSVRQRMVAALERGAASQHRQGEDAWCKAFTELQNKIEDLQRSLSGPHGQTALTPSTTSLDPGAADVSSVVQGLNTTVKQLTTDMAALKGSVDAFDGKLGKYVETSRGLQDIWSEWYGIDYRGERTEIFVQEIRDAISLYQMLSKRCGKPGSSVAQTKAQWEHTLADLESIRKTYFNEWLRENALLPEIAARVKIKLANDAAAVNDYKAIERSLSEFRMEMKTREISSNSDTVRSLLAERSQLSEWLGKYHPHRNFIQTIVAVGSDYEVIIKQVKGVLPNQEGTVPDMVTSLATEYLKLRPAAERAQSLEAERNRLLTELTTAQLKLEAGKELAQEIARQLNYKTEELNEDAQAITNTLEQLRKERDESVYLQLRLGLSSALIALEKAISISGSDEQREVIEALLLDNVKKGIVSLLGEMKQYSGEQLWSRGIFLGFSQKWLHDLIRADLLLRTYYDHRKEFGLLRRSVSQACSTLIAALYEFQVEVAELELFEDLPENMVKEQVYASLRNLPAVRDKVKSKIQDIHIGDVVVDITSFPYFVKGVQENHGRASLANPSAWLQQ